MAVDTIKVLGERNTATNLLEELLEHNTSIAVIDNDVSRRYMRFFAALKRRLGPRAFHAVAQPLRDVLFLAVLRNQHGWKHALVTERYLARRPDTLAIVAVTKDPYAWLRSLRKRPYHRKPSRQQAGETFSDFLRAPWPTVRRERAARRYENPVELWNAKTLSYGLLLDHPHAAVCRYEDLIADMEGTLRTVAGTCGFAVADDLWLPDRSAKGGDERSTDDIVDYYRSRRFLEVFGPEDLRFVNERLDPRAMALGGYELVPVDDPASKSNGSTSR